MNPLRIGDKPGEDTRFYVRSVLSFMMDSFQAFHDGNIDVCDGTYLGAVAVLNVCIDALKEPAEEPSEEEAEK